MPPEARTKLDRGQEAAAACDGYDDSFFGWSTTSRRSRSPSLRRFPQRPQAAKALGGLIRWM